MSNLFFKKHIGQDTSEPANVAPPAPEITRQPEPAAPAAAPAATYAAAARPSATRNVLSSDVEIKGTVKFTNDLVVDGKIEGNITSDGNLTIGENARIKAEIKTSTVIVYGKVHGNITAVERIELKASAEVVGDIKAKVLAIEAGAIFVGKSTVGTPANAPAAPQAATTLTAPTLTAPSTAKAATPTQGTLAGTNL